MPTPTMHVTRWGETGPRVVLVHGSTQGSPTGGDRHFKAQERLGAQGWQLLVPDRPGHGRSPDPGRPDDAEADGALVAELIGDGAHVVGHSFGACVALAAVVRRLSQVHSLTVIEPAMPLLAMNHPVVLRFGLKIAFTSVFPMPGATRIKRFMKLVNIPPEIRGTEGASHEELTRMGHAISKLKLPTKQGLLAQWAQVREAKIPVLAVAGSWSPAFQKITEVVAEVAHGKSMVIPSPHHFPQQVSDEFNQVLVKFMQESDALRA